MDAKIHERSKLPSGLSARAHNDSSPDLEPAPVSPPDSGHHSDKLPLGPPPLPDPATSSPPSPSPTPSLIPGLAPRLYTSHFLSTWNSRLFEFGAVLFLAHIYPSTLLPLSTYALCRSAAAILFSRLVGWLIDTRSRLAVVRWSILVQRVVVAASCTIFVVLERGVLNVSSDNGNENTGTGLGQPGSVGRTKDGLFALLVILASVEKLASIANLVAVERDWVVVITEGNEDARRALNSRMRRIDLICKLVGPLVISLVDGASPPIAIWTTLGMNVASVVPEYVCISSVYHMAPSLKRSTSTTDGDAIELPSTTTPPLPPPPSREPHPNSFKSFAHSILPISSLPFYFAHPALLPSLSLSLLYLTVLSFSGQMITFLLSLSPSSASSSSPYTPILIGVLRTVSTVFELSATWIAPRLMTRLSVVRAGLWSISWQMIWLAAGTCWFFSVGSSTSTSGGSSILEPGGFATVSAASGLVAAVVLSRVGLWGFDLCAQMIVQDEVQSTHRGAFSTVETSFQNLFELLSFASTIVFPRPSQFQWPVLFSAGATYLAGGLYAWFVRRRRGHLFHKPRCVCPRPHHRGSDSEGC